MMGLTEEEVTAANVTQLTDHIRQVYDPKTVHNSLASLVVMNDLRGLHERYRLIEVTRRAAISAGVDRDGIRLVMRAGRNIERSLSILISAMRANGQLRPPHDSRSTVPTYTDYGIKSSANLPLIEARRYADTPLNVWEKVLDAACQGKLVPSRGVVGQLLDGLTPSGPTTPEAVGELANEGYDSRQIAEKLGVTDKFVRRFARANGIVIRETRKGRRTLDTPRVLTSATASLQGVVMGLELLRPEQLLDLDPEQAREWERIIRESLPVLRKTMKGLTNVYRNTD